MNCQELDVDVDVGGGHWMKVGGVSAIMVLASCRL